MKGEAAKEQQNIDRYLEVKALGISKAVETGKMHWLTATRAKNAMDTLKDLQYQEKDGAKEDLPEKYEHTFKGDDEPT